MYFQNLSLYITSGEDDFVILYFYCTYKTNNSCFSRFRLNKMNSLSPDILELLNEGLERRRRYGSGSSTSSTSSAGFIPYSTYVRRSQVDKIKFISISQLWLLLFFNLFLPFQTNITIFATNKCKKCPSSICTVLGFKPTTFGTWVSSHNQ